MKLPFTITEFFNVFENYNRAFWPAQIVLFLLALFAVFNLVKKSRQSSRMVFSILSFLWLWMGMAYHILFFSAINNVAYIFGIVFIIQGILFLYHGAIKQNLAVKFTSRVPGMIGLFLIAYALVIYPLLSFAGGHIYPGTPTFGVPCPTTIFTLGMLMFSSKRIPWFIAVVPLLWSVIGFSAAIHLSVKEDFGLFIAGVLLTFFMLFYTPEL